MNNLFQNRTTDLFQETKEQFYTAPFVDATEYSVLCIVHGVWYTIHEFGTVYPITINNLIAMLDSTYTVKYSRGGLGSNVYIRWLITEVNGGNTWTWNAVTLDPMLPNHDIWYTYTKKKPVFEVSQDTKYTIKLQANCSVANTTAYCKTVTVKIHYLDNGV